MNQNYKHTQVGYLIIASIGVVVFSAVFTMIMGEFDWFPFIVLVIIVICLGLFSSLTVKIDGGFLKVSFGPGVIKKRFLLRDIISCRAVKNPWYYGWGIRLTPSGWLFNVSGFLAVEILMRNTKKYRLGTDDAENLVRAIQREIVLYK